MMHTNLNVQVRIKPTDLINALKKNKEAHKEEYTEALEEWRLKVFARANEIAKACQDNRLDEDMTIFLQKPVDNTALYDKYIGMFAMCTDEEIAIGSEAYGCIIDDNWDWAVSAKTVNSMYSNSRR